MGELVVFREHGTETCTRGEIQSYIYELRGETCTHKMHAFTIDQSNRYAFTIEQSNRYTVQSHTSCCSLPGIDMIQLSSTRGVLALGRREARMGRRVDPTEALSRCSRSEVMGRGML